jgi:WD40 repeat protein
MLRGNTKKLLFCSFAFFMNASCMEIDVPLAPTLYSLCKKQAAMGYGKSRDDRKKNAFELVQRFSAMVDGDLAKDVQRSFLSYWLYNGGLCARTTLEDTSSNVNPVMLMKKGKQLYGVADKNLYTWDFSHSDQGMGVVRKCRRINGSGRNMSYGLASKKRPLVYLGTDDNKILVLDTVYQAIIHSIDAFGTRVKIRSLAEDDEGDLYSTCCEGGSIDVWDVEYGKLKKCIESPRLNKIICSLLVDKDMVYTGGFDFIRATTNIIDIYDVRAGKYVHALDAHEGSIRCLIKSKQDTDFYSAGFDGKIKLWDIRNVEMCKRECLGPERSINCLQEGAEGYLLFGGRDGLEVWDMTADEPSAKNIIAEKYVHDMVHDSDEAKVYISTKTAVEVLSSGCTFDQVVEKDEK